jgi:hypothetical protein
MIISLHKAVIAIIIGKVTGIPIGAVKSPYHAYNFYINEQQKQIC